jgi:hypothetical protein
LSALRRSLVVPGFRALLSSYTINRAGDVVGMLALAVVVLAKTGSSLATAVLFLATQFLPGMIGPALVTRVEHRSTGRLLPVLYVVEAALFALLAVLVGTAGTAVIVILAFLDAALAFVARAITRSAVGTLLAPHELLPEGKAAFNVALAAAMIAGPVLAGIAVAGLSPAAALAIDGGSFLLAAALLARAPALRAVGRCGRSPGRRRLRAGLRYISGHPALRALVLGEGAAFVFFYLVVPVTVIYSARTLHAGSGGYAAILTGWGIGIAIGSAVQVRLARRVGSTMILVSTGAVAAGYLGTAAAPTLAVAVAASAVGGIGNGTQWASVETAIHQLVDEAFRTRVAAVLEALAAIAPGAGILLGGTLSALLSPRMAYLAAGIGLVILIAAAKVIGLSVPSIQTRRADATSPAAPAAPASPPPAHSQPRAA